MVYTIQQGVEIDNNRLIHEMNLEPRKQILFMLKEIKLPCLACN